jgi:hypothetical protein
MDTLVAYYQMETRLEIRVILLKLFKALGVVHPPVLPVLQTSVLPVELARDMMVDPHNQVRCSSLSSSQPPLATNLMVDPHNQVRCVF